MDPYHLMLLLLSAGFLLLGFGFNFRDHQWGMALMGAGILVTLAPIAYRLHLALQLPY